MYINNCDSAVLKSYSREKKLEEREHSQIYKSNMIQNEGN